MGVAPEVLWVDAVKRWREETNPGMPDRLRLKRLASLSAEPLPISSTDVARLATGLSNGSWNRLIGLISQIHKHSGVTPPTLTRRKPPPGRTRWLSEQEWQRLEKRLNKLSPLLADCARFAITTGLRENNVLNLEWSQVDIKRRMAFIEAQQVKNRETLGIPLSDAAVAVLTSRRGLHKQFVFAHPDSGKPLVKASNRAWYKAVKKAKLKGFRWHDLRHTWASWAVQSGVSLRELMELGGWKSFSMVIRYSHLSKDHLASAVAKIKPV